MELVQGQYYSGSKIVCCCGNCGVSITLTRSSYMARKKQSKSGNLFCSSRCHGMYRRNKNNNGKESLSAQEILDSYFEKPKTLTGQGYGRLGGGGQCPPPHQFLSGRGTGNLIARKEQE